MSHDNSLPFLKLLFLGTLSQQGEKEFILETDKLQSTASTKVAGE